MEEPLKEFLDCRPKPQMRGLRLTQNAPTPAWRLTGRENPTNSCNLRRGREGFHQ